MGNTALKFNAKILMVIFAMFLGLCIASAIAVVTARVPGAGSKGMVLVVQVLQNGIAFFLPAVLCAWLFTRRPWHDLRYDVAPTWTAVAVVVAMYVVSIPAMNYLVDWNAHISFPAGMSGVEHTLRHYEDVAQQATTGLLKGNSLSMMLAMVMVVGVITAIGEETFFRGSLLGLCIDRPINRHVAVIGIGVLFSAFHMQFFGFVPRMVLGMWLGYLMVWTRSLWVPIMAHALNNSMVVIAYYLAEHGLLQLEVFNKLGVPDAGHFPVLALCSALAVAALCVWAGRLLDRQPA